MFADVTDPGDALSSAVRLAARIAQNAPLAIAATKRLMRDGLGISEAEYWVQQQQMIETVFPSADAREGAAAFAEKRRALWSGT
jgi:enoyl-CoA hydratase